MSILNNALVIMIQAFQMDESFMLTQTPDL